MTRPSAVSAAAMAAPRTGVAMMTADGKNADGRRRYRGALPPGTGRTRRRRERSRLADIIPSRGTIQRIDIDHAANAIPVFKDGITAIGSRSATPLRLPRMLQRQITRPHQNDIFR